MKLIWQGIALLLTLSATVTGVLLLANVGADEEHLCPPGLSLVAVACFLRNYSELSVGLLGVSGAIFAAWIAWAAVQRQIAEQRAALMLTLMGREEERLEAKLPGIKKQQGLLRILEKR